MKTEIKAFIIFLVVAHLFQFASGQSLGWAERIGGVDNDRSVGMAIDDNKNIYVTGNFEGHADFDPGNGSYFLDATAYWDAFVLKLDSAGNFCWAKKIGSTGNDFSSSLFVDSMRSIYIAGYFSGTSDFDPGVDTFFMTSVGQIDPFVLKLDSAGNFLWAKQFDGSFYASQCYDIFVDDSGNVYTTGYFTYLTDFDPGPAIYNLSASGNDAFVSKLDSNGSFVWAKQIGGYGSAYGIKLSAGKNGGVLVTGNFSGSNDFNPDSADVDSLTGGQSDLFYLYLGANGDFHGVTHIAGIGDGRAQIFALATDTSGNIYSMGTFRNTVDFKDGPDTFNLTTVGQYNDDIFLLKLDSAGRFLWVNQLGGPYDGLTGFEAGNGIAVSSHGEIYVTGKYYGTADFDPDSGTVTETAVAGSDVFIAKYDTGGTFISVWSVGGFSLEVGNAIVCDTADNIYLTGNFADVADFDPGSGIFNLTSASPATDDVFILSLKKSSVGVPEFKKVKSLIVTPNPSNGLLSIKSESAIGEIRVFNFFGNLIFAAEHVTSKEMAIDLSEVAAGIYLVKTSTLNTQYFGKIIIE